MKITNRISATIVAAGCCAMVTGYGASKAAGATVTAQFSYSNLVVANVMSPDTTGNVNVNTVSFEWTRLDSPGIGVDDTLPGQFPTFCIEIAQHVRANTAYEYEVFSPSDIGWSAGRIAAMQMLWADHYGQVNSGDTSAAFQLAVWELVYDDDRNLDTGPFRANSPGPAKSIAQGWLTSIGTVANRGELPELHVLVNEEVQDQITATEIPAPGPAACAMLGLVVLGSSRRRRR